VLRAMLRIQRKPMTRCSAKRGWLQNTMYIRPTKNFDWWNHRNFHQSELFIQIPLVSSSSPIIVGMRVWILALSCRDFLFKIIEFFHSWLRFGINSVARSSVHSDWLRADQSKK